VFRFPLVARWHGGVMIDNEKAREKRGRIQAAIRYRICGRHMGDFDNGEPAICSLSAAHTPPCEWERAVVFRGRRRPTRSGRGRRVTRP
jgi:hypothetical protein